MFIFAPPTFSFWLTVQTAVFSGFLIWELVVLGWFKKRGIKFHPYLYSYWPCFYTWWPVSREAKSKALRRLCLSFLVSVHRIYLPGCLEKFTNAERRETSWPWEAQTRLGLSCTVNSFVSLQLFWYLHVDCLLREASVSPGALFIHQPEKLQYRPVIVHSQRVKTHVLRFLCQQMGEAKNSCKHGWYFCIIYIETFHGWASPWLWGKNKKKEKKKAFPGLSKKAPLFLCYSLYAVYAT